MSDEEHRHLAEKLTKTQELLRTATAVIESFRPLATATKAIVDDGWPKWSSDALPASLLARLRALSAAYEGIADMVADADAEAGP